MQLQVAHELGRIYQSDCLAFLAEMDDASVDLVFADPPFNIGYEYDEYHDRQDYDEYVNWSQNWMNEVHRVLKSDGTFWLAIGDEYAAELKVTARDIGFTTRSWVVWYYTFGVNCVKKFSRSHVHLFHFVKDEDNFTFNADDPGIRVPSARALVYADKRANPAGRLPDDTWILRPQDVPKGFRPTDDTWYFARVAGTFSERQGFHGCQMPEQLLGRIIRASSNAGNVVFDPFAGSGTTLAVSKKLGRHWIGCELSREYVRAATERLDSVRIGDPLDGPENPVQSAPSTANGRKLEPSIPVKQIECESKEQVPRHINHASANYERQSLNGISSQGIPRTDLRMAIERAIIDAFYATHDGYSTDWLLANPILQASFHEACRNAGLIGEPADWNRKLLRLRKSGGFPKESKLKKVQIPAIEMDNYRFAAEIAWRLTSEKHNEATLDEIFCDLVKSAYFDRIAARYAPGYDPAGCRWAALRLRKASKELICDMKRFHFIYKTRDFPRRAVNWSSLNKDKFVGQAGLYLLQGELKEPLFLDSALDLGTRLLQHQVSKVEKSLRYISVIPTEELPSCEYQGGFKVHLVGRHKPRLNVNLAGIAEESAM